MTWIYRHRYPTLFLQLFIIFIIKFIIITNSLLCFILSLIITQETLIWMRKLNKKESPSPAMQEHSAQVKATQQNIAPPEIQELPAKAKEATAAPANQSEETTLQDLKTQSDTITHRQHKPIEDPNTLNRYRTFQTIGATAGGGGSAVYKALYCPQDITELQKLQPHELYLTMKVIDLEPQQDYLSLIALVNKNLQLDHPNILEIKNQSTSDVKFWVAFPFMDEGSLRCLMASCFKNGFPEELIAIALKEALKGLVYLHQQGYEHREFNSGHIYFGLEIPAIKIGFLASIYEHNSEYSQPPESLPETTICDWAAAPEVYNLSGDYTDKSDVWLVGITAMELAFGGMRVRNRQDLEALIAELINSGGNGDKESDDQNGTGKKKSMAKIFKKMVKTSMSSKSKVKKDSVSEASLTVIDRKLSQSFKEMLGECLNKDPEKRPTADVLLQHDFFEKCNDLFFFQDAVWLAKRERKHF